MPEPQLSNDIPKFDELCDPMVREIGPCPTRRGDGRAVRIHVSTGHSDVHLRQEVPTLLASPQSDQDAAIGN